MRQTPLLSLLCCMKCGGMVSLSRVEETADDGHILTGSLACESCQQAYPIYGGIPRFTSDYAAKTVENTVKGFGYQWNRANQVVKQIDNQEIFLDFIAPVQPDHFKDKLVLDGGCGQARFTTLAEEFGAKGVIGVDLSEAVEAAFANTRASDNILIIQADLFNLPLRPLFDYAFSVGVLHHTANPAGAFAKLATLIKTGGSLSVWVYGKENNNWIIYGLNPLRKYVTSHLPRPLLWLISYLLAVPLFLTIRFLYLPVSHSKWLGFLRNYLFYYDYLCWLGKHCGFQEQALVIFDHLVPEIAEYIPKTELISWFENANFSHVTITSRANNSWRGFGVKER